MKRLLFLAFFVAALANLATAQTHRALIRQGHGAAKPQELAQAVFAAFQENKFESLHQYMPDDVEMRQLKRRSSLDMRALLEKLTPDSISQTMRHEFTEISENSTANGFNWQDWTLSDVKVLQHDSKNPLLYKIQITLASATAEEKYLVLEAIKAKNRYFLFRQIAFQDHL